MARPSSGSIQRRPVAPMTIAPMMMAMLERASPKLWTRMLRKFRSPRPRTSARVMPPLTARAASEVQIIQLSTTSTGERKRSIDS